MAGRNLPTMKYAVDHYHHGDSTRDEPDESHEVGNLPGAVRQAFDTALEYYERGNLRTNMTDDGNIGFYEAGQPGEVVIREISEDEDSGDRPFGETGPGRARASASIYVRRPLNDYTGLEEVFEFYVVEPSYDQAERGGVPGVRYYVTRESRTGRPGVDNEEFSAGMMPVQQVPDEVRYRAKRILDHVEWPSDHEEVDDDADD